MNMEKHRKHKESIEDVFPFSRKIIFWSSVSLFCIYGGIYVGTEEIAGNMNNMTTLFGVQFFGVTENKFWYFLLIINIYYAIKFAFSVVRTVIVADSWSVFKDIISTTDFDRGMSEAKIHIIEKDIKSRSHMGGITKIDGGKMELSDPETKSENERELLLLMKYYHGMGLLEYFFAPIIFPACLSLWTLTMLVIQVLC